MENTIFVENCLITMERMPEAYIDLVVTSPPYDDLRRYNGFSFDFSSVSRALLRVLKPGGVLVWVVGDSTKNGSESGTSFKQALAFKELGFNLHDTMIYEKQNYIPLTHNRYEQAFEFMFVFSKGKPKTFNPIKEACKTAGQQTAGRTFYQTNNQNTPTSAHGLNEVAQEKIKSNIWKMSTNAGAKGHPAQFPERLAEDHILSWSNPGDIVYDPFSGAGTVAKLSKKLNRIFIGSEISADYAAIAEARLTE